MEKGLVMDIDRFSVHDGPGIRGTVFLKGCPLSCKWCHSPESQKNFPELIYQNNQYVMCGEWRSAKDILEIFIKDKPFYDNSGGGVTITGGEILAQANFAKHFLMLCVRSGIHTAIETCGFGSKDALIEIAKWSDLIFYDIKLMDNRLHEKYTGVPNDLILANLAALCTNNADKLIIRIPCIPDINDSPEQIMEIAHLAKQYGVRHVEALPYNPSAGAKYEWLKRKYELEGLKPRSQSYYDELNGLINSILGG